MVHALRILVGSLLLLAAFRPVWGQWCQVAAEAEELDTVTWLAEANGMLFAAGSSTTWLLRSIDRGHLFTSSDLQESETYMGWVERFQPAVPGAGEDPMGEGLPLLLRYVLGLDSVEAGRVRLPVLRFVDDGLYRFAALDPELRDQMPGVLNSLEASDDLHEWVRVTVRQRFAEWTTDQRKRVLLQDRRPIGENGKWKPGPAQKALTAEVSPRS